MVLEAEDGTPYLYTGTEVDKQGSKGDTQTNIEASPAVFGNSAVVAMHGGKIVGMKLE
ncbi:hypothetical protein COLU111180_15020 [Cohnella lubricantis]|uniref:Uncharacterized protein n=1 Tax=Cohnella lubricantis TaxID=2163172 RepID=A0A841TF89_9BACL|nr:hypothetical protein [Cohnella lubricantis]MBB6677890.1 hypothetical protein [Cohnella lubricantis]MBP2119073.1 hypothetical protein [Cohnella lubricantis]